MRCGEHGRFTRDKRDQTLQTGPSLADRVDARLFGSLYSRSLVYNTCWEDPAVDRQAVALNRNDVLLVITSAGCNVLDYALVAPRRIHAVDANPRQTALLELKIAGVRALDFEDFFRALGTGFHPNWPALYHRRLREQLSPFARGYWDRRQEWFTGRRGSFYFHGLSGLVACGFRAYLRLRRKLAAHVVALFDATCMEEQRRIYDERVAPEVWSPLLRWTLSRQLTLSLLGVPHPQRREVQAQHPGGVAAYVRDSLEYVLRELPISSNYFWRVYLHGRYTRDCCPEYLRETNFAALKAGLIDRVVPHTCTVTDFLRECPEPISKFVLLDHMDWMAGHDAQALDEEWTQILAHCAPGARVIFRSAHIRPSYLETIAVRGERLMERLTFHDALARTLSLQDRVHTYAGFHICDVSA